MGGLYDAATLHVLVTGLLQTRSHYECNEMCSAKWQARPALNTFNTPARVRDELPCPTNGMTNALGDVHLQDFEKLNT